MDRPSMNLSGLPNAESRRGVGVNVLDEDLGNPGSNPQSACGSIPGDLAYLAGLL